MNSLHCDARHRTDCQRKFNGRASHTRRHDLTTKRVLVGLCLLACCLLFVDRTVAAEPFRLRVLSYNIHHGEGVDGLLDLARIAKVINSVSPDIVALQEVDRKTTRVKNVDQPAELSRLTEMRVVFERNIDLTGGEYGNAVLTRFPIVRSRNHHLQSVDMGEQRGVLEVLLKVPGGPRQILFLATHFDHRRDATERKQSATFINELITNDANRSLSAILAGDLNARPDSDVLKIVAQSWQRSNREILPTIPVAVPRSQIDYVLYRPADHWKVVETRVLSEAVASDHRPIFAVLEWIGPPMSDAP